MFSLPTVHHLRHLVIDAFIDETVQVDVAVSDTPDCPEKVHELFSSVPFFFFFNQMKDAAFNPLYFQYALSSLCGQPALYFFPSPSPFVCRARSPRLDKTI